MNYEELLIQNKQEHLLDYIKNKHVIPICPEVFGGLTIPRLPSEIKDNKVRIYVFNTGKNISKENINKIWNRFYKEDSSRNRQNGGTGIGLSLVKAIMENYKNEYGVENKINGVEFYFDLDLTK